MKNIIKKYHLLYKTTNVLNGKYYYGIHSTNKIEDGYLGSGKHFRHSLRKYGKDNFKREIIKQFDNREELIEAEIELITKDIVLDKYCMNLKPGGNVGLCGMVTVKDKYGKCFNVFPDDLRYLSGELVSVATNRVHVKDKDGNSFSVFRDDVRYLNGELFSASINTITVKDKDGNILRVSLDNERYLSGELIGVTKDKVTVKDKDGNTLMVDINDERYLSGELKHYWKDKKHTNETKDKISNSMKGKQTGSKNGSYGSCWITKDGQNKKIKKELLQSFINDGWIKGRK